jgi:hypothetical protein
MTEREIDQTKGELVRALRRRARSSTLHEAALAEATVGGVRAPVIRPTDPAAAVAFYARETFQLTVFARPTEVGLAVG